MRDLLDFLEMLVLTLAIPFLIFIGGPLMLAAVVGFLAGVR